MIRLCVTGRVAGLLFRRVTLNSDKAGNFPSLDPGRALPLFLASLPAAAYITSIQPLYAIAFELHRLLAIMRENLRARSFPYWGC